MDQIRKLLSVDLCDVLLGFFLCCENENTTVSNHDIVDSPSYTIRHNYPKRLVTYDAEERGEPRLIRLSDLTESVMNLLRPSCTKSESQKKEKCEINKKRKNECEDIKDEFEPNKMIKVERSFQNKMPNKKCQVNNKKKEKDKLVDDFLKSLFSGESFTKERLKQLEQCGKILYERFIQRQTDEGNEVSTKSMKWESLQPMQKFGFYWQALTGHVLYPTPYENFKDIFIRRYRRKFPRAGTMHLREEVRRCWHCLKNEERVPYNLNALLYHVSTGQVDPFDHCAVRVLLNRWR